MQISLFHHCSKLVRTLWLNKYNLRFNSQHLLVQLALTDITADFSGDRVTGSGGCNRFMGSYKTKGNNQLSISPLASTRKACEESLMTQESRFVKALQTAQRYEVNDQGLQIFYKTEQGTGVLRFTSQNVRGLW